MKHRLVYQEDKKRFVILDRGEVVTWFDSYLEAVQWLNRTYPGAGKWQDDVGDFSQLKEPVRLM